MTHNKKIRSIFSLIFLCLLVAIVVGISIPYSNDSVAQADGEEENEIELTTTFLENSKEENTYTEETDDYYYVLDSGDYYLSDNLTLNENVLLESNCSVNIYLNGYVLDMNGYYFVNYGDEGYVYIFDDQTTEHYFTYSNTNRWGYVSAPTQENKDGAIVCDDIDENTEEDAIIKVSGGVITNAVGKIIDVNTNTEYSFAGVNIVGNKNLCLKAADNVLFDDVNIIGNNFEDSSLITSLNDFVGIELIDTKIMYNVGANFNGIVSGSGRIRLYNNTVIQNNYNYDTDSGEHTLCNINLESGNLQIFFEGFSGNLGLYSDDDANIGTDSANISEYLHCDKQGYAITFDTYIDQEDTINYNFYIKKQYNVVFKGYDDDNVIEIKKVTSGDLVEPIDEDKVPEKEGFTFVGWSVLMHHYVPVDFSQKITDNETFYAYYYVDITEPTIDNNYTISSDETISAQWYQSNVECGCDFYYYDDDEGGYPVDDYDTEYIYLDYGYYSYYGCIESEEDTDGDPNKGYKNAIELWFDFNINSCYFEFKYYNGDLSNKNAIKEIYNSGSDTIEKMQFGTIEKIDDYTYRYICIPVDGSYGFYLCADSSFEVEEIECFYLQDILMGGFDNLKFEYDSDVFYYSGEYFAEITCNGRDAGRTQNITAYNINLHFNEDITFSDMSVAKLKGTNLYQYTSNLAIPNNMKITNWQYIKNGVKYDITEDTILTEDIDIYPVYTLTEIELTKEYLENLEGTYKKLSTGKYVLSEDIKLDFYLQIEYGSVVEIYLNGHVIDCNCDYRIINKGSLEIYGGEEKKDYYFDYSGQAWQYIANPSNEEIENAITLDEYDPTEDTSSKTYTVIKVSGYGLITHNSGHLVQSEANTYLEDVLFIGAESYTHSGAIHTTNGGVIYAKGCEFYGNRAQFGGVISNAYGTTFESCIMRFNYASNYGGALYTLENPVTIKGYTIIKDNYTDAGINSYRCLWTGGVFIIDNSFNGYVEMDTDESGYFGYATEQGKVNYFVMNDDNISVVTYCGKTFYNVDDDYYTIAEYYNEETGLYELYIKTANKIEFVTNDEDLEIDPILVIWGEKISAPTAIPQREGYTFAGWSTDQYRKYIIDFDEDRFYGDKTLYAMFNINFDEPSADNNYTVTLEKENDEVKYYWYLERDLYQIDLDDDDAHYLFDLWPGSYDNGILISEEYDITSTRTMNIICLYSYYLYSGSYIEFTYTGSEQLSPFSVIEEREYWNESEYFISGTIEEIGEDRYRYYMNYDEEDGYCQFYIELNNSFEISDVEIFAYADRYLENDTATLGAVTKAGKYYCEVDYDKYTYNNSEYYNYCFSDYVYAYDVALFDSKDATTALEKAVILDGTTLKDILSKVTIAPRDHYDIVWYMITDNGDVKVDKDTKVTSDMNVYYTFELSEYLVTFDSEDGSNVPEIKVNYDGTIDSVNNPTKEGYTFGGWYKDEALTNAWNFDTDKVTEDTTLFAKWIKNETTEVKEVVTTVETGVSGGAVAGIAIGCSVGTIAITYLILGFALYKKGKMEVFCAKIFKWIKK